MKRSTHLTSTIEMRTNMPQGRGHKVLCHCRHQNLLAVGGHDRDTSLGNPTLQLEVMQVHFVAAYM